MGNRFSASPATHCVKREWTGSFCYETNGSIRHSHHDSPLVIASKTTPHPTAKAGVSTLVDPKSLGNFARLEDPINWQTGPMGRTGAAHPNVAIGCPFYNAMPKQQSVARAINNICKPQISGITIVIEHATVIFPSSITDAGAGTGYRGSPRIVAGTTTAPIPPPSTIAPIRFAGNIVKSIPITMAYRKSSATQHRKYKPRRRFRSSLMFSSFFSVRS